MSSYSGTCFCGAVGIEVEGEPVAQGYCHCESCRSWSASPVNAFILWKPEQVRVTKGSEHIGAYQKTKNSDRQFCRLCGGHLFTNHPGWGLIDVFSATTPDVPFKPQLHVNYGETALRIQDGLPKLKDFPAEMGGSGETLPE